MSVKAAPHELAEQPFLGTPRPLPRILLCHATEQFCGRHWIANSMPDYERTTRERQAHEVFCATRAQLVLPDRPGGS